MNNFYVYALFRESGVPFYVGKGKGKRWAFHEKQARSGARGHKAAIIRDMQARGVEVIKVKLHEGLAEAVAHAYEVALIAAIGRGDDGPLVNRTEGGEGATGLRHTVKMRAAMSAARRGRKLTPETRAKLSVALSGRKLSPEHRERLSVGRRGIEYSPETRANMSAGQRGKKFSVEARANMSTAQRGKKHSPETLAKILLGRQAHFARLRAEALALAP